MIIVIGDKHYPHVQIEDLSLTHVMALQRELVLTDISSCKSWADVRRMVGEFQALPTKKRPDHPEFLFLTALTVWAARVTSGERLSLLDAVDVPLDRLRFVAEPHDLEPGGKAPARSSQTGSAPGAGSPRPAAKRKKKSR